MLAIHRHRQQHGGYQREGGGGVVKVKGGQLYDDGRFDFEWWAKWIMGLKFKSKKCKLYVWWRICVSNMQRTLTTRVWNAICNFYKRQNIWIEISPKFMSHTMHLRSFNLGIKKLKMTWRPTVFIITYQAVLAHRFILVGVAQQWWVDESLSPAWLAVKGEVGMEDQNV